MTAPAVDTRQKATISFIDFEHEPTRVQFNFGFNKSAAIVDALIGSVVSTSNFIAACSNASVKMVVAAGARDFRTDQAPAKAGNYPNAEDKAVLFFWDTDGNTFKMEIPAPKDALFGPDGETIDDTASALTDLVGALSAAADGVSGYIPLSPSGNPIVGLYRGYRSRAKGQSEAPGYFTAKG